MYVVEYISASASVSVYRLRLLLDVVVVVSALRDGDLAFADVNTLPTIISTFSAFVLPSPRQTRQDNSSLRRSKQYLTRDYYDQGKKLPRQDTRMAPPPNTPSDKPAALNATYTSPSHPSETPRTFHHPLASSLDFSSPADAENTKTKTSYLSELRVAATELQAEINEFLTERMEEDKALAATGDGGGERERKEEERYMEGGDEEEDEDAI